MNVEHVDALPAGKRCEADGRAIDRAEQGQIVRDSRREGGFVVHRRRPSLLLARGITWIDERVHFICIDDTAMRMMFERFAFCELEQSKKTSRRLQFVLELQLMQSRCAASNFTRKRMQPRQRAWCV